jgi:hypothetical protein
LAKDPHYVTNQLLFLSPDGSMGPIYVLPFLFCENYKIANDSRTTTAREKVCRDLESLEFYKNFAVVWLNLKTIEFYLTKLATDF